MGPRAVVALLMTCALLAACGPGERPAGPPALPSGAVPSQAAPWQAGPSQAGPGPAPSAGFGPEADRARGTFLPYRPGANAVTYDAAVVPPP